jgi:hypothetical protein
MSYPERFDQEEYEQLIESIYDFQVSDRFSNSDSDIEKVMDILTKIRKIEYENNLPHHFYSDDYEGEDESESDEEEESKSDSEN